MTLVREEQIPRVPAIRRGAVSAAEALTIGWRATEDQYWHLLALTASGFVVGSLVPFGLFMGPAMCGIHLCYLAKLDGQRASSDLLVRGMDFFIPSLAATLLTSLAMSLATLPFLVYYFVGFYRMLMAGMGGDPGFDPTTFVVGAFVLFGLGLLVQLQIPFFFMFSYLLIVDKGLGGTRSLLVSARAVWANLAGLIGLFMLGSAIVLAIVALPFAVAWMFVSGVEAVIIGLLLGLIGSVFSLPPLFGALTVAYRRIFPAESEG